MANAEDLRIVQIGRQTVYATPVAAAALLSGVTDFTWQPGYVIKPLVSLTGSMAPSMGHIQVGQNPTFELTQYFTPQDAPYVLDSAINQPVITGAGPYVYTHSGLLATSDARARTVEFYDGNKQYEFIGSYVTSFDISAPDGDVWMLKSAWTCQDWVEDTLTPALTARTYTALASSNTQIWLDDLGGTIGTTVMNQALIGWNLSFNTGLHSKQFQSGSVKPGAAGISRPSAQLTVTLEATTAGGVAELAKYRSGTGRLVRLKSANGSTHGQIDFAGVYTSVAPAWGKRNGNTTLTLTLNAQYDSAVFAQWCKVICQSAVATLIVGA